MNTIPKAKTQTHCDNCGKKDDDMYPEIIDGERVYLCSECAKEQYEKSR